MALNTIRVALLSLGILLGCDINFNKSNDILGHCRQCLLIQSADQTQENAAPGDRCVFGDQLERMPEPLQTRIMERLQSADRRCKNAMRMGMQKKAAYNKIGKKLIAEVIENNVVKEYLSAIEYCDHCSAANDNEQ